MSIVRLPVFRWIALGAIAAGALSASSAQAPGTTATAPTLSFESASLSIRAMAPGTYLVKNYPHTPPFVIPSSNKFAEAAHAQDLIMEAYGVSEYQIMYLPASMRTREGVVYDVEAKAKGDSIPTPAQYQQMMQSLLADRFHLKAHWETKPKFSVYALVPDKNGPKFHEFEKGKSETTAAGGQFRGTTIFALAHFLSPNMDLPVIDGTGFGDKVFDFDIDSLVDFHEVDREQATDPQQAQDYLRSSVLGVLGLKLDSRKVSMQMLVIDHIDEPSMH